MAPSVNGMDNLDIISYNALLSNLLLPFLKAIYVQNIEFVFCLPIWLIAVEEKLVYAKLHTGTLETCCLEIYVHQCIGVGQDQCVGDKGCWVEQCCLKLLKYI